MKLSHLILAGCGGVAALTPAEWRSQSIYQVMTDRFGRTDNSTTAVCNTADQAYCGGSWQGIINHLDYIQGMGFTAIWISPFVAQMPGQTSDGASYHGYWAQNIYEVNSAFGTADDLKALSDELHGRGMYLMADIVTNHYAYNGCGTCVDYSIFTPFDSESYFHSFCLIDYDNVTSIKVCWEGDNIVSLPDLRTEDSDVLDIWNSWIQDVVANYSIDGVRLDSTQQVDDAFLSSFESAAGVYIVGEVFNGDPSYVCPYQSYVSGLMNYPTYYWVTQAFQSTSGSISNLVNGINTMKSTCSDVTLLGSFLENHDNPRFPSFTSDMSLARNAIAFTMLMDGIPIIYEGQEQHLSGGAVPYDREAIWLTGYDMSSGSAPLYTFIAVLNQIRNFAVNANSTYLDYHAYPAYSDSSTIVMRKGFDNNQIIGIFSNLGVSGSSYTLTLTSGETGFSASAGVVEVIGCTSVTTDSSGSLAVSMSGGQPRVFYPLAQLQGSGICPGITGSGSQSTTTRTTSTSTCTPTSVSATFNELVTTVYGDTVKIVGSISTLGNWNTASGIALSASQYTSNNPVWSVTVPLAPGAVVQYKFIKVSSSGSVTWEAGPNHTLTVPASCATTAIAVTNSWQN